MKYDIVEVRDSEGRRAYQLAERGHEPAGQLYYSKRAAKEGARYYERLQKDIESATVIRPAARR
jgi:hypothetical protein